MKTITPPSLTLFSKTGRIMVDYFQYSTLCFVLAITTSCGILNPAPEAIDNYPNDFEQFLQQENLHRQYADLVYFLADNGVHDTVPVWQLLQQGTDWQRHKLPKYAIPPRALWSDIINTLVFLKYELVPYIGPVKVLSGYRTSIYNLVGGGAGESRHLRFSALDLRPVNKIDRSRLHNILQNRWKNFGKQYNLGLGLYSGSRFHIDTGGYRRW